MYTHSSECFLLYQNYALQIFEHLQTFRHYTVYIYTQLLIKFFYYKLNVCTIQTQS